MVNMNVGYVRPARSLTTLQTELNQVWPNRLPDLGFVTGYKSAENFSGHNPNNLGVVMGYDIGTYVNGAINEPDGRELADYLRTDCNEKLQYLIHDMSAGAPKPMIAGNHTNWKWVPYAGADAHSNHIHLSIVDLFWGDSTPSVPASVYDSTSSWGIVNRFKPGTKPLSGSVSIIKEKDWLDTMTPAEKKALLDAAAKINRYVDTKSSDVAKHVWGTPVKRAGGNVSALQELADAKTTALQNKAALGSTGGFDYEKLSNLIISKIESGSFKIVGAK